MGLGDRSLQASGFWLHSSTGRQYNTRESLIPLDIFGYRDFSLHNVGVAIIAFATIALLQLMFYAQAVCGQCRPTWRC